MKTVKIFTDLELANAYVTQINEAYEKEAAAGKAQALEITAFSTAAVKDRLALNEALEEVSVLGEKLALTEKHGSEGLIVTVNKKSYTLHGDTFVYGGSTKTALELSKDQTQLNLMVKKESGALVQIN